MSESKEIIPSSEIISFRSKELMPSSEFNIICASALKPLSDPQIQNVDRFGEIKNSSKEYACTLDKLSSHDLAKVQIINSLSPTILIKELKPLLSDNKGKSHIIVVTSKEGNINARQNSMCHVHINQTKSSLNMLVKIIALDYVRSGIYVNAVDPGYVSSPEFPDEPMPLSCDDAVSRIVHAMFGENYGKRKCGVVYKNYIGKEL